MLSLHLSCVVPCLVKVYFVVYSLFRQQAILLLGNRDTQDDSETERIKKALLPLYLNLSITKLHLDSPRNALKYAKKALEIDSANTKALFRCGQVRWGLCWFVFQPAR